ncbi:MAG: hypothetical protein JXK08_04450 [Flavobacteriaceae bacterium]|nr:hypothetical protein [Flavobacteriaceae bacterium]
MKHYLKFFLSVIFLVGCLTFITSCTEEDDTDCPPGAEYNFETQQCEYPTLPGVS